MASLFLLTIFRLLTTKVFYVLLLLLKYYHDNRIHLHNKRIFQKKEFYYPLPRDIHVDLDRIFDKKKMVYY